MVSDLASVASSNDDSYVESDNGSDILGEADALTTESDRNSTTHTDSLHGASAGSDSVADSMAKKDTNAACQLRVLVIALFIFMSVFVPIIIFLTVRNNEQESFESEFDALATKVIDSFEFNVARKLGAIDSLDISITSYAVGTNSTFPFVTLPDFDLRAANTLALADTFSIVFVPLVTQANRVKWESYAVENEEWITTALNRQTASVGRHEQETLGLVTPWITAFDEDGALVRQPDGAETYFPVWQNAPVDTGIINFNVASVGSFTAGILHMVETGQAVLGEVAEFTSNELLIEQYYEQLLVYEDEGYEGEPVSNMFYPVFDKFGRDHELVGMLNIVIFWHAFFRGILPSNARGIICVVNNACGQSFTYRIDGQETSYVGNGDLHDGSYDSLKQVYKINDVQQSSSFTFRETAIPLSTDHCPYTLTVYPSGTLEDEYVTYKPALYTFFVALAFVLISAVAITYDCVVQRRLKSVLDSALESRAIVSSLFPANVRDRLFEDDGKVQKKERTFGESADDKNSDKDRILASHPAKLRLKNFLHEGPARDAPDVNILHTKPIADLFPHCTVLFADIAGFTAWSSEREPAQVFMLLQTIFHFFDNIARKWGVFKVETIGDCYVAVTGLPDPQRDHAIRMTKFARECLHKVTDLTHKLESTLGPDTGDLKMRFGLHSGPVTAGVLRGEKSRFQLFGDTVNTASRMESTGKKNFIQVSQSTADQLVEAGKESWITPREGLVTAKGKGQIQTYWVTIKTQRNTSSSGTDPESDIRSGNGLSSLDDASKPFVSQKIYLEHQPTQNRKLKRLVDWQTDILARLLKPVLAQRGNKSSKNIADPATALTKGDCVLDEVVETLVLPKFDAIAAKANVNPNSIEVSSAVMSQLRDFVNEMATRYLDNPFHNFEHASHVTMSASKFLNRIIIPEDVNYQRKSAKAIASDLHDYTYGITSDPLTQFTVIFCALIHDVDHRGVSNFQLANEIPEMATKYKNRGLAEQNSVDVAWDLLMQPQYKDLQIAIFSNELELQRFRQLVVNLVMSTDIFDKDSKALRNSRWDKAFHRNPSALPLSEEDTTNLKATIVIEHIIQAADVAHTMQHWHVYQKWNDRLFQEMYAAFEQGRSASDPSAGWYKGELWFFDNYVIPLAKKLDECNVFGVASDEGLNYALANRAEWDVKGEHIVADMLERYKERKNYGIVNGIVDVKVESVAGS